MARLRNNRWQSDAEYMGKRKRFSFKTREEAEAWERAVKKANETGAPLPPTSNPRSAHALTFAQFAEQHFYTLWGDIRSRDTVQSQINIMNQYIGDLPIASINEGVIEKLKADLRASGSKPGTINRKLSCLSVIFKHAASDGVNAISRRPAFRLVKENNGRLRFLDVAEEKKLCDYFLGRNWFDAYHIVRFLIYTGARRGEALKLQWRDVDLKRGTVSFWETKTDRPRTIPLVGPAKEAVEWSQKQKYPSPFPCKAWDLRKWWDTARIDLGYAEDSQFVVHTLRHTCASRLVQRGVDLRRVKDYLGHSDIQTTLRYAHLATNDLHSAAMALIAAE